MRLLVVDHNALEPSARKVYDAMVGHGGIELCLMVPSRWHNNFRLLHFQAPTDAPAYELVASDVFFPTRTHRLIYRALARHVARFQPDVLYMNAEPENFQTFQAARLCAAGQRKLVFSSWRNIDHVREGYPYKGEALHRAIEKYVLKRAVHGIVFNRQAKAIFALHGYDATTVIPPAVDTGVFFPREPQARATHRFTVGFAGRFIEGKGLDLLLHALAQLPPEFAAVLVGAGPEETRLRQLAEKLGLAERVEFLSPLEPRRLAECMCTWDAVVLPSRTTPYWREQFGRILAEAMACGIPVIGSSSGEIPHVIADAGLVFKEGSVEGLRLGLLRLASDRPLRQELRKRGIRRVQDHFSLHVVARQMHGLFQELAGRNQAVAVESRGPIP